MPAAAPSQAGRKESVSFRDIEEAPPPNYGPGIAFTVPKPTTYATPAAPSAGGYDPVATRQALAGYAAREAQDQQSRTAAMQANANWASAWTANRDAQNNARVSAFRATNGADMVLAPNNAGYDEQRKAIIADAARTGEAAKGAAAELTKAQAALGGPPRNYIDEFGKLQRAGAEQTTAQALATTAGSRVTEAGSRAELERAQAQGIKLNNEQHQKILTLADSMGQAKTPAEARAFERQIVALTGKNPAEWRAIKLGGEERFVNGMPAGKDPDRLVLFNEQTREVQEIGGGGGGPTRVASAESQKALKAAPTPENIREYDSNYGQGAAARLLGK
jgi:hypothetical protein